MFRYFKMTIDHPAYMNDKPVEVVCIEGEHNYNMLIAINRQYPYLRFEEITNKTAYGILEHLLDGVGVGVYLPLGNDRENRLSRMGAALKAQVLKSLMKGFRVDTPKAMFPAHKGIDRPKPANRPILSLVFSG